MDHSTYFWTKHIQHHGMEPSLSWFWLPNKGVVGNILSYKIIHYTRCKSGIPPIDPIYEPTFMQERCRTPSIPNNLSRSFLSSLYQIICRSHSLISSLHSTHKQVFPLATPSTYRKFATMIKFYGKCLFHTKEKLNMYCDFFWRKFWKGIYTFDMKTTAILQEWGSSFY